MTITRRGLVVAALAALAFSVAGTPTASAARTKTQHARSAPSVAGAVYKLSARVRVAGPRRMVCFRVRETARRSRVGFASTCRVARRPWRSFRVMRYRAKTNGRLTIYIISRKRRGRVHVSRVKVTTPRPATPTTPPATPTTPPAAPTTPPATPTSPPATPTTPPSSSTPPAPADRFYSADSPFNQPIAPGAAVDSNSAQMVQTLVSGAARGFAISAKGWTTPLYYADASTPRTTFRLTAEWGIARTMTGVPVPANAQPDPEGDGHLTIVDRASGCEYDFWQAHRAEDGSWSASWGNATDTKTGIYEGGFAATAAGFTNTAGKIWPDELRRGRIKHALVFAFPHTKAGGPVPPATSSDGDSTHPGAIPEGARLQLDPELDLDTLSLAPWQRTIARALQEYGMYLGDTGDTVGLSAIHADSFPGTPYPWGDVAHATMPVQLLERMRVLKLPPQYEPEGRLVRTKCARLR